MKTEIKTEAGRVHLIYRGEDYGSYPLKIISFEKKDTVTLLVRICESVLLSEKTFNVLVGGVQLTEDNFKELLFDNLTKPAEPEPKITVFTEDGTFTAPTGVTAVEVFAVGGGGSGAYGDYASGYLNYVRNGGSGGQVVLQTIPVIPGSTYGISIGQGGVQTGQKSGNPGGDTSFANSVTAVGGLGGYKLNTMQWMNFTQPVVEGSATSGWRIIGTSHTPNEPRGEDGVLCPFDLSSFPDLNGKKFGAAGSTGASSFRGYSSETGGGIGGYQGFAGTKDGTFYGAGGGGGAYMSSEGGSGYQGILIIRY
ncbi:MAG: hypothetical protein LBU37_10305 [Tannerellaceae bacterium]|jgi:hypothetical protein|nr:hypothetical protein [Tannerellaceae bacterium]